MVQIINIRRDVQDTFYRYKMPALQSKIEGKGNGIKTVVPNLAEIAKSLSRDPLYIMKFFGFELGAQTKYDAPTERYIVNGAHDANKLQDLLDVFIKKFVLCRSCQNPETDLSVAKDGRISADCKACGVHYDLDQSHKLIGFIQKNPPKKKSKKSKKATRENGDADADDTHGGDKDNGSPAPIGDDDDDDLTRRIRAEAAGLSASVDDDNVDWSLDTSSSAAKARMADLESGVVSKLTLDNGAGSDDDEAEAADSPYEQLGTWIEENLGAVSDVEIFKKAQELGIEAKHKTMTVLAQALFDKNIVKQIPQHAALLSKVSQGERHEKALLGGIERFVGITHPELQKLLPKILMELYQLDLISEEVVTRWGSTKSKKYVDKDTSKKVRKLAEPFLKWLEEAESSGEDDDEDDDDN